MIIAYELLVTMTIFLTELIENNEYLNTLAPIQKVRTLYNSCLNTTRIEDRGLQPLTDLLSDLGEWPVLNPHWTSQGKNWIDTLVKLRLFNNQPLFKTWVHADEREPLKNILQIDQAELGLPTKNFFKQKSKTDAYLKFMKDVANLLQASRERADEHLGEVLRFEKRLSGFLAEEASRRDLKKMYKKMTLKELSRNTTNIDWMRFFTKVFQSVNINITQETEVVVYNLKYLIDLDSLIAEEKANTDAEPLFETTIQNYVVWLMVKNRLKNMGKKYSSARLPFREVMFGTTQEQARWRDCVTVTNNFLGFATSRLFVDRYFDESSKKVALEMIGKVRDSFNEILKELDWMDDEARKTAKEKADAIRDSIGYPEFIQNNTALNNYYKSVTVNESNYFENYLEFLKFTTRRDLSRLDKPVDKTIWHTPPTTVNAFYNPMFNMITFPAAILQPPFYNENFPKYINYGGIATVIGHEITHGFDDRGRLFDKDGKMRTWWSDEVVKKFEKRASCIINQYGNYLVEEVNKTINGVQTQGENIADNGGLKQAFRAYKKLVREGLREQVLPGIDLNPDQLFFLNFAQVWCGSERKEYSMQTLTNGKHSPGRFRVIGTLQNSGDFAKAFKCANGSPMNPENKCSLW
ncbi:DgyrCDS4569 [Dimorphilus gyrociliatus]|uniref:DgyrCDS4569 n=1 Tax=Dimorphilus gyrociliatus TaxID=2664684 RepID=A0A7I8VHX0_9ANNE|nr:DgyrCDS4569 [Dimorphilus gyrociliatus]